MPIKKNPLPSLESLKELLAYDPDSGVFTWLVNNRRIKVGDTAGWPSGSLKNYLAIKHCDRQYALHRIAWLFLTGEDPGEMDVDHINGDTKDNRAQNLRLATHSENMRNQKHHRNNRLRARGVHQKPNGLYAASISCDRRRFHLGNYETVHEASIAYRAAAVVAHGIFQRVE